MDVKEKVQKQFGKNAEKYVRSKSHATGPDLESMIEVIKPHSSWIVLDIATGGGHVAKKLAPYVKQVYATDLTKQMLEKTKEFLQQYENIFYMIADAESLPFLDNSFDLVTCRIAPHHFPHPERFIAEVARILLPGGKFVLIDNVAPEDSDLGAYMNTFERLRDESHLRCLSVSEWHSLCEKNGLSIVHSRTRKKTHDYPVWVNVTTENEEQAQRVTDYILNGSEKCKEYYQVTLENNEIQSITVDECMIVGQK